MQEAVLRDFSQEDYGPLEDIVEDEWDFHIYSDDWKSLARGYLDFMISRSGFVKVADVGGKAVGIVCASSVLPSSEEDEPSDDASQYEKERVMFDRIDFELKRQYCQEDMGELVLILVSADFKKKGIGSLFLSGVRDYLTKAGCKGMFISTDTDCDYGFYQHIGCEFLGSRECPSQGKTIVRSLYRLMY